MGDESLNDAVEAAEEIVAEANAEANAEVDERSDVERERDEYLGTLQRLQADFENYRKRVARQADDAATRATGDLVAKLLPVLDAFDLARAHLSPGESDESAVALAQVEGLLLDALAKEGLERIAESGVPFDPQVHDAVAHEAGEGGPTVVEVLRAGYRWKGAVIRAAMVRVTG